MKQRKHLIFAAFGLLSLAIIYAISSSRIFDTFNRKTLIQSTFGADLTPYIGNSFQWIMIAWQDSSHLGKNTRSGQPLAE